MSDEPRFRPGAWRFDYVLMIAGVSVLLTSMLTAAFVRSDESGRMEPADVSKALVWQAPGMLACWILCLATVRLVDPRGVRALGLGPRVVADVFRGIAWYVPLGAVWWGITLTYVNVMSAVVAEVPRQDALIAFTQNRELLARIAMTFSIVVAAPLGEEMFFRGVLHGWLRKHLPFWPAAAVVGVLFGVMHGLWFAFPLAVFGVMLCWLRERRGGLWACIAFHSLHNAATLIMALTLAAAEGDG